MVDPPATAAPEAGQPSRALWEPPSGPPVRPPGAPATYGPRGRLSEYRSVEQQPHQRGRPLRLVWAWIGGEWQDASVRAECRDEDGWRWVWVSRTGGNSWVLQARTVERAPSPADLT